MKKVLCLIFLFAMIVGIKQSSANFVYNAHGKKDPFSPLVSSSGALVSYDGDVSAAEMTLEGIILDSSGKNLAIVNGKVVKVLDKVGTYTVEAIANDHVNLVKGEERVTVKIKKGAAL
jgi:hypothetical protein